MRQPRFQFGLGFLLLLMLAAGIYSGSMHVISRSYSGVISLAMSASGLAYHMVLIAGLVVSLKRYKTRPKVYGMSGIACGLILFSHVCNYVFNAWLQINPSSTIANDNESFMTAIGWVMMLQTLLMAGGLACFLSAIHEADRGRNASDSEESPRARQDVATGALRGRGDET